MKKYSAILELNTKLNLLRNEEKAKFFPKFFKTAKGEYAEGDKFIGITVPQVRKLAKEYKSIEQKNLLNLLQSPWHELRLMALFILIQSFEKGNEKTKQKIYNLYKKNYKFIDNWDLVDTSAPKIMGAFLENQNRSILYQWAKSKNLWKRRIAIMSTFYFIKNHDFNDALAISKILLTDKHDLIHKAVGWMLREIGNRDFKVEEKFLRSHYKDMPRTTLRYAIEKFPINIRHLYMKGQI